MAILIDTSLLVDRELGVLSTDIEAQIGDEERAISVITVSDLLHGVHRADDEHRVVRQAFVEHLLAGIDAIEITETVARVHAGVWAQLQATGNVIGARDLWIAATALAHGMGVATTNVSDFCRVPGLRVIGPPA